MGTKIFDLVTLTFVFDLLFENFNLAYIFLFIGTKDFDISHECSL
jgi:hypothetical protein